MQKLHPSTGRLKTRKWQDKDGKDVYTTEVIADNLQLLGGREGAGGGDSGVQRLAGHRHQALRLRGALADHKAAPQIQSLLRSPVAPHWPFRQAQTALVLHCPHASPK